MNRFELEDGKEIILCDDCEEYAEVSGVKLRWLGKDDPGGSCDHCHCTDWGKS